MKNSDMPAMPLTGDAYVDFSWYDGTTNTSYNPKCQGLTKREYFAGLAIQGLIPKFEGHIVAIQSIAICATEYADALLKELDK